MKKGQAALTLIFFSLVAIIVTSGAVMAIVSNTLSVSKMEQGTRAYYVAEAGIENAVLRLLRDPSYQGETLTVSPIGQAIITVEGNLTKTVISQGQAGMINRKIEVIIDYNDNVLQIVSIKEKP